MAIHYVWFCIILLLENLHYCSKVSTVYATCALGLASMDIIYIDVGFYCIRQRTSMLYDA